MNTEVEPINIMPVEKSKEMSLGHEKPHTSCQTGKNNLTPWKIWDAVGLRRDSVEKLPERVQSYFGPMWYHICRSKGR